MFSKRQTQKKSSTHHISHTRHHVHTQAQPHAHHTPYAHAHTHYAFLYVKMYTCTYCGRKVPLAKFCYDKMNALNSHVWVRKTNILGPKKIWVPKPTSILNDIGTHALRFQDVGSGDTLVVVTQDT